MIPDDFFNTNTTPPREISSDMRLSALGLWDIYNSWLEVGFTEAQAFRMLLTLLSGGK